MSTTIDCSIGEGGGSIVRISVALAAALNKSLELLKIRANRPNPGLRAQHIEAINAIRKLSGIEVKGVALGSEKISVSPSVSGTNEATVRIATAGSIPLVAQAVQYYSLNDKRRMRLNINGGATHGKWAPSIEYIENVTFRLLRKMNKNITTNIEKYGFYPSGGAKSHFIFHEHTKLLPLNLTERGSLKEVQIFSVASSHLKKRNVAERQINSFVKNIDSSIKIKPFIKYVESNSPGAGLTVINHYSSGCVKGCFIPGEKSISAEKIGDMCKSKWAELERNLASVDSYAADQLIVPMSFAEGVSIITTDKITNHTKTNIELVQNFIHSQITVTEKNNIFYIEVNTN